MADWQQIVALIVTAAAGLYLARRLRRQTADPASSACGGCAGCDKRLGAAQTKTLPIVDVDALAASAERGGKSRK